LNIGKNIQVSNKLKWSSISTIKEINVEALGSDCKYPDLERMLWLWQTMAVEKGVSVSDLLL